MLLSSILIVPKLLIVPKQILELPFRGIEISKKTP